MHDAVVRRGRGEPLQYVTGEMPFPPHRAALRARGAHSAPRDGGSGRRSPRASMRPRLPSCNPRAKFPSPPPRQGSGRECRGASPLATSREKGEALVEEGAKPAATRRAPVQWNWLLRAGDWHRYRLHCALYCERAPGTRVVATDLAPVRWRSPRAIVTLGLEHAVTVVEGDWPPPSTGVSWGPSYAVLVSNPPYIPRPLCPSLPAGGHWLRARPRARWGEDGWTSSGILELAPRALMPGGMLCCELFEDNVGTAAELVRAQSGWASADVREDLTHRPRPCRRPRGATRLSG